ncbi:MAG: hypothetical protein M0R06_09320 [Sphaerochaeta sp.]|jgi:hypothetical protein|nr:hypothetical protein [Sphaerochaeta sp.]
MAKKATREEEIKDVLEDVEKMKPEQKKRILYALKGAVLVSETEDEDDAE